MSENSLTSILHHQFLALKYIFKWLFINALVGALVGLVSAFFLITLDQTTAFRDAHPMLIWGLPVGGFLVGLLYHYFGKSVASGNNLLIETIQDPHKEKIPFKMAPWVYIGTMITHFFGGSAGREGTALQMAGAIADQFSKPLKLTTEDRKTLLVAAVAAGFGSVFGTPLAGALFALEFFIVGKLNYKSLFPALLAALIADWVCQSVGAHHVHYQIDLVPKLSAVNIGYALVVGVVCALVSQLFSESMHLLNALYSRFIKFSPLRPLVGGILVALLIVIFSGYRYTGLGVSTIQASFIEHLPWYTFLLKVFFTVLTLSAGFKGGEVTPLFFIGAALGNALAFWVPLPLSLLAGMGFVAVFSGATNTPLACTLMAIELFGAECGVYAAVACVAAFVCSGKSTIYKSQWISKTL